ncbi:MULTISPECIES: hypothetical protein [unclassified Pseudomonas]|uniref:helix-turn-helix domain-containing protein n=1 Tax=unclassified Pseudomonas TaxID=196821 RepID=UPI0007309731|nr:MULTISPECIES: hypothetical protein [unclassified Pseudomonas]KSW28435.1 hypothetical protein AOX63_00075 [Pseudomonas sp. ADP]OBP09737.1 hypothetical protein BAE52_17765 [Pseudomonas sp. EGD-AKN5]QOF85608.1 hypothetical protein IG194_02545 [Pseudomonas sp. ADPe]
MTVQKMIAALLATGLSQKALAELAGTTQPTIHRAAKGAGVRYETGKEIERIYHERSSLQRSEDQAPKAQAMEGSQ